MFVRNWYSWFNWIKNHLHLCGLCFETDSIGQKKKKYDSGRYTDQPGCQKSLLPSISLTVLTLPPPSQTKSVRSLEDHLTALVTILLLKGLHGKKNSKGLLPEKINLNRPSQMVLQKLMSNGGFLYKAIFRFSTVESKYDPVFFINI